MTHQDDFITYPDGSQKWVPKRQDPRTGINKPGMFSSGWYLLPFALVGFILWTAIIVVLLRWWQA